jgi:hypothetical protein
MTSHQSPPLSAHLRAFGSLLSVFVLSPIVGIQALLPLFLNEGLFVGKCGEEVASQFPRHSKANLPVVAACAEQKIAINLMFNMAVTIMNVAIAFASFLITRFSSNGPMGRLPGIRRTYMVGVALQLAGQAMIGVLPAKQYPEVVFLGYQVLAVATSFTAFPLMELPAQVYISVVWQSRVFSLFMGAFDGSALIFTLFHILYQAVERVTIREIFFGYMAVTAGLGATVLLLMGFTPVNREQGSSGAVQEDYYFPPEPAHVAANKAPLLINSSTGDLALALSSPSSSSASSSSHAAAWRQYMSCLRFPFFIALVYACSMVNAKYFLISSLNNTVFNLLGGDSARTEQVMTAFSWMLPLSALAFPVIAPLVALRSSAASTDPADMTRAPNDALGPVIVVLITVAANVGLCVTLSSSSLAAQYATSALVVFNRYAFFAVVPTIFASMYGPSRGMMLMSVCYTGAGIYNLISYIWTLVVHHQGGRYRAMDLGVLGAAAAAGLLFALFLVRWSTTRRADRPRYELQRKRDGCEPFLTLSGNFRDPKDFEPSGDM